MGVYDRAVDTAKRLVGKYGDKCTWKKRNGTVYNVVIVFAEQGNFLSFIAQSLAADSAQVRGAYEAIMADVSFNPEQGDLLTRSDGTQLILGPVAELKPGSQTVLYLLKFGA